MTRSTPNISSSGKTRPQSDKDHVALAFVQRDVLAHFAQAAQRADVHGHGRGRCRPARSGGGAAGAALAAPAAAAAGPGGRRGGWRRAPRPFWARAGPWARPPWRAACGAVWRFWFRFRRYGPRAGGGSGRPGGRAWAGPFLLVQFFPIRCPPEQLTPRPADAQRRPPDPGEPTPWGRGHDLRYRIQRGRAACCCQGHFRAHGSIRPDATGPAKNTALQLVLL